MWKYLISHRQLLLRAVKSPGYLTRIDLLFTNVSFMQISTSFNGLSVYEADPGELGVTQAALPYSGYKVFKLTDSIGFGYVVGASFIHREDNREYNEDSQLNNILSF